MHIYFMKPICYLFVFNIFTVAAFGQNAKSFFKAGSNLSENGKYDKAIEQFSKALELDGEYTDAYIGRGKAFETKGNFASAAKDYGQAILLEPGNEEFHYLTGRAYYKLGDFTKAIEVLDKGITMKPNYVPSYQVMARALMANHNYKNAKIIAELALGKKNDAENNYLYGLVHFYLEDLTSAEMYFLASIKKDDNYLDAYAELARLKLKTKKLDEALSHCNKAIALQPGESKHYVLRSRVYKEKLDMNNAINDMSKAIIMEPDNANFYFQRGLFYKDFIQHQSAIHDFSKVVSLDPENTQAYLYRAKTYEEVSDFKSAIKDYKKLLETAQNNAEAQALLEEAKLRLFELNKESDPPVITLTSPTGIVEDMIYIPGNKQELFIEGQITDESVLKYVKVNGMVSPTTTLDDAYMFSAKLALPLTTKVLIETSDVYGNVSSKTYAIKLTETQAPQIKLIAPYASDNGEIYLASDDPNLYIEGSISDESKIKSIMVDGVNASFKPDEMNPTFSATINIRNKNEITMQVVDTYGNQTTQKYIFNREGALYSAENPMGKTWVIFIENSDYENYPSLEGPAKDVTSMRSALANYQIHNIIHKKNLTKRDMERFFNIELRDLVRSNHVNSLLIWYAGHGKYINETGYWIPVDAKREDEFSFFNTGNLKASMQLYSKYITHLLLITDACESGPTFYQAMRGGAVKRDCNDWTASRFKSSQVFTSAGYELAVDNSQFTRTFASTLANNPNACIPIDDIVVKVQEAVKGSNQQVPTFGRIQGLEHEDGTFFFMAK
jgi:tetratricopeptide (TPR) repeat protein